METDTDPVSAELDALPPDADEATRQFASALELQAQDPDGTTRERYDLLVSYADACRWSTRRQR
mgnify:CR=1 FL=1